MLNFERSSLNQKLTIISLLSTGTALLFVFVAFAVTSVLNHRKDEGMQLSSFAGVIGTNSVDALLFNDRNAGADHLVGPEGQGGNFRRRSCTTATASCSRATSPPGRAEQEADDVAPIDIDEDALAAANCQGSTFWSHAHAPVPPGHRQPTTRSAS